MNNLIGNIKVEYTPLTLINALEANKRAHVLEYGKAVEVYESDLAAAFNEAVRLASEARATKSVEPLYAATAGINKLTKPVNNEKLYDQYITMFKNTASKIVVLSLTEANAIVNDEWDWAVAAKVLNSGYSSRRPG
jgi:hypothetical protein